MFGIGYQEMFIILVVAMVIFGPSRLPELAGQVGRWVRDFRRMSSDLTGEFEKTFAEVDEVKRTIKREMAAIQDEVEGVSRSARGDLKKTGKGGKKAANAALKAGTGSGGAGKSARPAAAAPTRVAAAEAPAAAAPANGARAALPQREQRQRSGRGGKFGARADMAALPVATKTDPLADVSFFDLDAEVVALPNGPLPASNGSAANDGEEALSRVRRRRAAAGYGRLPTV
jgi:Tat protein translocase TatB subunit